jgi:hypothetical protein
MAALVDTVMNLTFAQEGKTFLDNTSKYEPFSEDPAAVLNYLLYFGRTIWKISILFRIIHFDVIKYSLDL